MNDFIETKTAQERYKENTRHRIESAYFIRDLIDKSEDTRLLYTTLLDMGEVRVVSMMRVMADADKVVPGPDDEPKTVPFENKDFWKHVGIIEGLEYIRKEIHWMIMLANEDEKRAEKEG
ncbi:hypothetical protein LCGC14_0671770 [marine sediment metagenome]|uniref:Uncharacterized protein n=1 Tax=marine sediment metagenome TaxID=412755 RepID=A0A0F9TC59_9ZZZZ|nr:hypothetical protein [Candidatus Aminicenantes bacterium]